MKNVFFILFISVISILSCSKKEPQDLYPADSPKANYDTMAVDSFSAGAISVDVAEQIRKSSQKYQDSLKEALKIQEQEKKIKEELEQENKKKAEEEKKQKALETSASNN
jgi:mannitol-specific phosphotransferase system IIBC component